MLGLSNIIISICYSKHSLSAKWVFHNHPFSSSVLSQACMYTTPQCMKFQVHVSEKVSTKRKSYQSVGTWFDVFTTIKKIKQHLHTRNKFSSSVMGNILMDLEHYAQGQMYQSQIQPEQMYWMPEPWQYHVSFKLVTLIWVVTGGAYTFHTVEFQCQEHRWWATHMQWKSDKLILFKEQDTWSLSDFRKRRPRLELSGIRTTSFTAFSSSLAGSGGSDALLTASCLSNSFKDPGQRWTRQSLFQNRKWSSNEDLNWDGS